MLNYACAAQQLTVFMNVGKILSMLIAHPCSGRYIERGSQLDLVASTRKQEHLRNQGTAQANVKQAHYY